jgi:predicted transcriptional regulator|tara:strand:- start:445 stop:624 length:180 start_codon:yes stop_codon:yes gene_type:complete
MYHPLEVKKLKDQLNKENDILHKHIKLLKELLEEREDTIKKLREELGRSGKTTWVEEND